MDSTVNGDRQVFLSLLSTACVLLMIRGTRGDGGFFFWWLYFLHMAQKSIILIYQALTMTTSVWFSISGTFMVFKLVSNILNLTKALKNLLPHNIYPS